MRLWGVCYRNRANPRQPATNHKLTASTTDARDIPPHITPTPEHYTENYIGNYAAYNGETTLAKPQVSDPTTPPCKKVRGKLPEIRAPRGRNSNRTSTQQQKPLPLSGPTGPNSTPKQG